MIAAQEKNGFFFEIHLENGFLSDFESIYLLLITVVCLVAQRTQNVLRQFSRPGKKWLRLLHFLCIIKYVSLISLLHIPPNFQGGMRQGVNITLPVCWNGRRGGLKILWWRHRVGSSPTTGTIKRIIPFGMIRFIFVWSGTRTSGTGS